MAAHVGEPEIAAVVTIRELLVFDAEQMQECGVQVVHMHLVLHRLVAEGIGRAVVIARLHAPAGHPDRDPTGM